MISKLMRLYKRSHGLRQICNIAVYIAHSACTIHLLNLPDKNAKRDIVHGVKHLEEIAEGWLCARRSLAIFSVLARKWQVELPEDATAVLTRTDAKFGNYASEIHSPTARQRSPQVMNPSQLAPPAMAQMQASVPNTNGYFKTATALPAAQASVAANTAALVRENSGNFTLPPQDANGLRAQQYPSAAPTPTAAGHGQHHSRDSLGSKSAASPSDMFGGVDQLIRESQDWVYRDQAQFALGFENWNAMDMDPSTWPTTNIVGDGSMPNGGAVAPAMPVSHTSAPAYPPMTGNAAGVANVGFPPNSWLNGVNTYNSIAGSYNEDEWYR